MYGNFSQQALEIWDYVRCQRPNGTHYGTRGKCRKGTEVAPSSKKAEGKFLGGGLEGKVYDIGRGRVLKVTKEDDPNLEAQRIASQEGLAPRTLAAGAMKKDPSQRKYQIIDRVQAEAIPGIGQPGRPSTPLEELEPEQIRKEKLAYQAALKLNAMGVEHGDLHGGNLMWDTERNRPVMLDFDNASIDKKAARREAQSLLSSIGIRLEEAGYYDEADSFYELSQSSSRNFYDKAQRLLEEEFPV
jgi:predicted Ser/Thr protein kinase